MAGVGARFFFWDTQTARQRRVVDDARRRKASGGYIEQQIGTTDDLQDADGIVVLDYGQAQKIARDWWRDEATA